ncbi:MAG: 16S rRNA (uracil(1498)-N(3))-methyltransferase, partial [Lachnospiraceae bacterium]|nr:16S rRNA (uracil(1498)-N(3))-methyltransferase [Lachnospiraceae bacterium]
MQHFFVEPEQIHDDQVSITGPDVKHMKQVLRMKEGEEFSVSNGTDGKEYFCKITQIGTEEIKGSVEHISGDSRELPVRIHLFQGLPKSDKMELIIQKAVELGVYEIIPMKTARCIMKVEDSKEKKKLERWRGISEAAAKQSKRGFIPKISGVVTYKEALNRASAMDVKMIPYEDARGMAHTRDVLDGIQPG